MKRTQVLNELCGSSEEELGTRIKRLEEELFAHRLKKFTNQLTDISLIRKTKREIALAKTVISGRKYGTETQGAKQEAKE